MSKHIRSSAALLFATMQIVLAQDMKQLGMITGRILDSSEKKPMEYASVMLLSQKDSALVTGTTSDANGSFSMGKINPGAYYLDIHFIGFEKKRIGNLEIGPSTLEIDLGTLLMKQTILQMQAVEVQAEAVPMSYQIDKKVINVGQQQTAISGSAVDVLENVPSVTVDIEGNVSLRGSSNFTVLIDGRPSVLEPGDALQQIPASTIDNIEIITNPSAKYKPEGGSGIINIVLKKDRRRGRSGIANLNAGFGDKVGGDFLLDYKNKKYHATFGVDYNRRFFTGDNREENQTTREGITSFVNSIGDSRRRDISFGARGELHLDLSRKDLIGFGARFGKRDSHRGSDQNFTEWSAPDVERLFYGGTTEQNRDRNFYALTMSYQHLFSPDGHELSAEMFFSRREGDEATTHGLFAGDATIISGRRTTEAGPSREVRARLDYALSLGENAKFEAGFESELERSDDLTALYEYDPGQGDYILQELFSNQARYDENAHALYAIFAGESKRLGYQAGLRGEYTDRAIELLGAAQRFSINRWDYFPTIHLSHQFAAGRQAMASYTRRIDRPGGGELEPFQTWIDTYNVRVGNPALKPEYIDSYEIGYQTNLGASLISAEAYYRKAHNKIEDVRSVYDDNITLHSVENIGTDHAFGSELSLNVDPIKKWNIHFMGNLYHYRIEGELFGEPFLRKSFNWNARMSNTIKVGAAAQIQLDGIYNSPSISPQGRREGFFTANVALKYEFLDKLVSATLQIRNILRSAKDVRISEGVDFYAYSYSTREAPVVMFNLKFNFNNYETERNRDGDAQDDDDSF